MSSDGRRVGREGDNYLYPAFGRPAKTRQPAGGPDRRLRPMARSIIRAVRAILG